MRYRAFGLTGAAVSAVSLTLSDPKGKLRTADWVKLIDAAIAIGVNTFEIVDPTPALLEAIPETLGRVERHFIFVIWRLREETAGTLTPGQIGAAIEALLTRTGLCWIDAALIEVDALEEAALEGLRGLRDQGRVRCIGVQGDSDELDACIASGLFDCVAMPFNLLSGWKERHRLKAASARDMGVFGLDVYPDVLHDAAKGPSVLRSSIWRRASDPQSGAGRYGFLSQTPGWTPHEICIAYALTEPALATIKLNVLDPKALDLLAKVPERDLPSQVPAQIEMARFSAPPDGVDRRRA